MRARAARLILLYHRIVELERDPHRLCVRPESFAAHLDELRRHVELVPLRELLERAPGPRAALTFDDGYSDNAETARTLLDASGAPATFFVTAGALGEEEPFWWDRLERLMLDGRPREPTLSIPIGGRPILIDVRTLAGRMRAHETVYRRVRRLPIAELEAVLEAVEDRYEPPPAAAPKPRGLDEAQLQELEAHPLFEIGGHTLRHPYLPSLSYEDQRGEIAGGRRALERVLARPLEAFSYPHGAFDRLTLRAVREAGYRIACSSAGGRLSVTSSRLHLPRTVVLDCDGPEFGRRLRGWLAA